MTTISSNSTWYRRAFDDLTSLFISPEKKLINESKALLNKMDELEQIPIKFTSYGDPAKTDNNEHIEQVLQLAEKIEKTLSKSCEKKAAENADFLKNKIVSLLYRIEKEKKGEINNEHYKKIKEKTRDWKQKPLDERDKKMLKKICRYSLFATRLFKDKKLLQDFLNWSIRDHNFPFAFIQYPALCKKLIDCRLSERIGFYGGKLLQIENISLEKQLTMAFRGKQISILDDSKLIEFNNGYCVSIKAIFQSFENNKKEIGNFEVFPNGISNWNPKRFAFYDGKNYKTIKMVSENWWENLPVVEEISTKSLKERYSVDISSNEWIITVKATRKNRTLSPVHTHSYLEIAIPTKNNTYKIYDFGKFTEIYPSTFFEYINTITNTLPAVICYPDENIFYTERETIGHSAIATPKEGKAIMQSIKKDIENIKSGNFVFQFGIENCSDWTWKKANHHLGNERIPNLFDVKFLKIACDDTSGMVFNFFKKIPPTILQKMLTTLFFIMGGWRGKTVTKKNGGQRRVSLLNKPPWNKENILRHPAILFAHQKV